MAGREDDVRRRQFLAATAAAAVGAPLTAAPHKRRRPS
ncbi:hypothetical protein DQ392_33720 [Streptomyces reniochalinae]|uniref:Twin-arginine translocation signal domain-containing protein n=1 Tax=Streptomyces reniochalinae TaxID=2250578 RepID=A0A367E5C9_9ACTN|nr:hypothetical protein DQ392_33720 [Streptomyces reniochalinae]